MDMDSFIASGGLEEEDPNRYIAPKIKAENQGSTSNDNIVRTRTYDLHITYDKYYQVRSKKGTPTFDKRKIIEIFIVDAR